MTPIGPIQRHPAAQTLDATHHGLPGHPNDSFRRQPIAEEVSVVNGSPQVLPKQIKHPVVGNTLPELVEQDFMVDALINDLVRSNLGHQVGGQHGKGSGVHITQIREAYEASGKEALSTWVQSTCSREAGDAAYMECIRGVDACPAGINILRGDLIDRPQEEEKFLILDRHLSYNINTRADLEKVRNFLYFSRQGKEGSPRTLPE
jgi:hypothetical protein